MVTKVGTSGPNVLTGTSGADVLFGLNGNDELIGGAGFDQLVGGRGNDTEEGGNGNDQLWGDAGDDELFGGDGNDYLEGGSGIDTIDGGDGFDTVDFYNIRTEVYISLEGSTTVRAWFNGVANDYVSNVENVNGSNYAGDLIEGDGLVNILAGWGGDDELWGRAGTDTLFGGKGNDSLYGEDDDDKLVGGKGNDVLDGGEGADEMFGGKGNDTFHFGQGDTLTFRKGDDTACAEQDICGEVTFCFYHPTRVEIYLPDCFSPEDSWIEGDSVIFDKNDNGIYDHGDLKIVGIGNAITQWYGPNGNPVQDAADDGAFIFYS